MRVIRLKKGYLLILGLILVALSISCVGAGLFGGDDSSNAKSEKIQMETQDIGGAIKISVPVGSKFEEGAVPNSMNYLNFDNKGEYSSDIMNIAYMTYEYDGSSYPNTNLLEKEGDLSVYKDNSLELYYVDKIIDGNTISLSGDNLDLLKEMANSVEIS